MDEKQMKSIIENCSDNDLQRLAEMVKKEKGKREDILQAEVNIMLNKIKGLVHAIEERGYIFTCHGEEIDANDLSWDWYNKE